MANTRAFIHTHTLTGGREGKERDRERGREGERQTRSERERANESEKEGMLQKGGHGTISPLCLLRQRLFEV